MIATLSRLLARAMRPEGENSDIRSFQRDRDTRWRATQRRDAAGRFSISRLLLCRAERARSRHPMERPNINGGSSHGKMISSSGVLCELRSSVWSDSAVSSRGTRRSRAEARSLGSRKSNSAKHHRDSSLCALPNEPSSERSLSISDIFAKDASKINQVARQQRRTHKSSYEDRSRKSRRESHPTCTEAKSNFTAHTCVPRQRPAVDVSAREISADSRRRKYGVQRRFDISFTAHAAIDRNASISMTGPGSPRTLSYYILHTKGNPSAIIRGNYATSQPRARAPEDPSITRDDVLRRDRSTARTFAEIEGVYASV